MEDVVMWASIVQAVSAAIIVGLTWETTKLLGEAQKANKLQAEANRLTEEALAAQLGATTPMLVWQPYGRGSDSEGKVIGNLQVINRGGGMAQQIVVETDWGEARVEEAILQPGDVGHASVTIRHEDWQPMSLPTAEWIRYQDAQGREQRVMARKARSA